jgi:hypothetical protein
LASIPSTFFQIALPGVASLLQCWSEGTTSAEVISLPLWKRTPLRSVKV